MQSWSAPSELPLEAEHCGRADGCGFLDLLSECLDVLRSMVNRRLTYPTMCYDDLCIGNW